VLIVLNYGSFKLLKTSGPVQACNENAVKDKSDPFQAWTGPKGSRKMRLPDFKSQHIKVVRLSALTLAAFTPRKYSWY